jgi:hypothetical protein
MYGIKQNDPLLIAIFWQLDLLEHMKVLKYEMLSTLFILSAIVATFF